MKGDAETGNNVAQHVIRKENKEYLVADNQDFSNLTTTPPWYVPQHVYNCKKATAKNGDGRYDQHLISQFEKCYHDIYCPTAQPQQKV